MFIGSENPIGKSSGATLIISKFKSSSGGDNYIGVIGPTRQNYRRTMELGAAARGAVCWKKSCSG